MGAARLAVVGAVVAAAAGAARAVEVPTNGPIIIARGGPGPFKYPDQRFTREPVFLEGGGERIPLDVAINEIQPPDQRVVLWPRRSLRPLTSYVLVTESGCAERHEYTTGRGPDTDVPAWLEEPVVLRARRDTVMMFGEVLKVTVGLHPNHPVKLVRLTHVCGDGTISDSSPVRVRPGEGEVELVAYCGGCEGVTDARALILVLEDDAGKLSAPRRLELQPPPRTPPPKSIGLFPLWLGVLLFGLLPGAFSFAVVSWFLSRRRTG